MRYVFSVDELLPCYIYRVCCSRLFILQWQVAALQEERSSLLAENQQLLERLNQSESSELTSTPLDRRCSQLQLQVEQLQEEMYRYMILLLCSPFAVLAQLDSGA